MSPNLLTLFDVAARGNYSVADDADMKSVADDVDFKSIADDTPGIACVADDTPEVVCLADDVETKSVGDDAGMISIGMSVADDVTFYVGADSVG